MQSMLNSSVKTLPSAAKYCRYWTYVKEEKVNCFLKGDRAETVRKPKHVSGSISKVPDRSLWRSQTDHDCLKSSPRFLSKVQLKLPPNAHIWSLHDTQACSQPSPPPSLDTFAKCTHKQRRLVGGQLFRWGRLSCQFLSFSHFYQYLTHRPACRHQPRQNVELSVKSKSLVASSPLTPPPPIAGDFIPHWLRKRFVVQNFSPSVWRQSRPEWGNRKVERPLWWDEISLW